jgi:hypothetical protein
LNSMLSSMLSIIAAGILWFVTFMHVFRGITWFCLKRFWNVLWLWMVGFFSWTKMKRSKCRVLFLLIGRRDFKSRMPIWLSCFWIFGKVVKRVNY